MIIIQHKLKKDIHIAVSGGVDSMAVANFLSRKHNVIPVFFHHGNDFAEEEYQFLKDQFGNKLVVGTSLSDKPSNQSQEEFWRNERYSFFHSFEVPIVTCHHLDDCVETWIWSSLHGEGKIIPYSNKNVIRPFRLNRKTEFLNWSRNHDVKWLEDDSNTDTRFMRNFIRHELMPKALVVNPGLHKVIKKKIEGENDRL